MSTRATTWETILNDVGVTDPYGTECGVAEMLHCHMRTIAKKSCRLPDTAQSHIQNYSDLGFNPFIIIDNDGYHYILTITEGRLLYSLQKKIVEQLLLKDTA